MACAARLIIILTFLYLGVSCTSFLGWIIIKFRMKDFFHHKVNTTSRPESSNSLIADVAHGKNIATSNTCEYYDRTTCSGSTEECRKIDTCEENRYNYCMVVWKHNTITNVTTLQQKGCFIISEECDEKPQCVTNGNHEFCYCCCIGDMCNEDPTCGPLPKWEDIIPPTDNPVLDDYPQLDERFVIGFCVMILGPTLLLLIIICVLYCCIQRTERIRTNEVLSSKPTLLSSQSSGNLSILLLEKKSSGHFGEVWRAMMNDKVVAVKMFFNEEEISWQTEQNMFSLPQMTHDNILFFMGTDKRLDYPQSHWIVTEYHENGSLYDYLKANTVTWPELCKIAESMARGLTHLHEAIPQSYIDGSKPIIAHRDFKSKNVLLKSDLTACIADLGLALVFDDGKPMGNTRTQVGTRRYMAPELLDGAINFSKDSFLRIDVYAFALVLWELASRCKITDSPIDDYKMPFEEEVGQHPTLDMMQRIVVNERQRPKISNNWRNHSGLFALFDAIIEECWDCDPEARLSASCAMERIVNLRKNFDCYGGDISVISIDSLGSLGGVCVDKNVSASD